MTDLIKRCLTGLIFVATVVTCVLWNRFSFALLFLVVLNLGLLEFNNLVSKYNGEKKNNWFLFVIGIIMFSSFNYAAFSGNIAALLTSIPFISILFISEIFRSDSNHYKRTASSVLGIVYIILPLSLLNFMGAFNSNYNFEIVMGYIALVWANDTGAYLFGVTLGKHKLFERISAKKTWEGAIGGALTSLGVGFAVYAYTSVLDLSDWMFIAAIVVVFGSLGDLVESSLK
ncbi:MAG: phosphatidate cytidylyltransferase, partial [Bacteroidetes bacterium]|nr:phosphatidate cytidylyltransferase [Bacteroidota bacterium]